MRAFCEKTGEEPEEAEKFFFQRSYSYYSSSSESRLTLQEALTQYENDPQVQKRKEKERLARKKLEPIFQKYAAMTGDEDAIFEDSLTAFYKDIGVNPEDNKMTLGLMWQMRGTTLGELRKEEFLQVSSCALIVAVTRFSIHLPLILHAVSQSHLSSLIISSYFLS